MTHAKKVKYDNRVQRTIEMALEYHSMGFIPIPVPAKQKGPRIKGWGDLRLSEDEIEEEWVEPNIALLLGPPSNNLVEVGLDCLGARIAGKILLPRTFMIHGRKSAPRSHYWYISPENSPIKLLDPESADCIVELRTSVETEGGKLKAFATNVPPSIHPDGEVLKWHKGRIRPLKIKAGKLQRSVHLIGAACLLAKLWKQGSRHDLALALAGVLVRAEFRKETSINIIRSICRVADDEEIKDRIRVIEDTYSRFQHEERVAGKKRLYKIASSESIVSEALNWLD